MIKLTSKAFMREATGLVREIGFFDHLITNMNGVVPFAAIVLTPWWVFFAAPGGDIFVAIFGGWFFSMFGSIIAYSMVSATFPRSAAPYVANSRILHPAIGWPVEVLMWLGWVMALALYTSFLLTWALIPGFYTIGVSSGIRWFINAAYALTNPMWGVIVGLLLIVPTSIIAMFGTRRLVRTFQLPATIIMWIGIAFTVGIWVTASKAQLDSVLPKYLGVDFNSIILEAKNSYSNYMVPPTYQFFPVMAAIAFTAGSFNTYWNAWAVGEVKRASDVKMQLLAMMIPSTLIAVLVAITSGAGQVKFGRDFLVAMTLILSYNPGFFANVPTMAGFSTMTLIPMMLANNPIIQFIIMLGMICATLAYIPVTWLIISREWFAWSFDRILPAKFAEVSERFHTPIWSYIANMVVALILMVLFIYYGQYLGFFTTAAWDTTLVTVTVLCLSAALLPLRKEFWGISPANKYKLGGIPVITIGGILGFVYNGAAVLVYTITPQLGFGLPSATLLIVVFLIPFALYWVVKSIRKKQGVDIDLIFRSLPPE